MQQKQGLATCMDKPNFGASVQYATEDTSPLLDAKDKKRVQEGVGTLLFHARAVDNTMLAALNTIAAAQPKSTQNTMEALTKLLNYCTLHPNPIVQYHASNMILWTDSNVSYLSAPKVQSQMGGFHFLSD